MMFADVANFGVRLFYGDLSVQFYSALPGLVLLADRADQAITGHSIFRRGE